MLRTQLLSRLHTSRPEATSARSHTSGATALHYTPPPLRACCSSICSTMLRCPREALPFRVGGAIQQCSTEPWLMWWPHSFLRKRHFSTTACCCCLSQCQQTISWRTIHHETSPALDVNFILSISVSRPICLCSSETHIQGHFRHRAQHTCNYHIQMCIQKYACTGC